MKDQHSNDPFADDIINRINPKIRASLSTAQLSGIKDAISPPESGAYTLDVRGVIPFFFARYYILFIVGRDNRPGIQITETYRKNRYSLMAGVIFALLLVLPFLFLLSLLVYYM
jgi:hypothetical protein